MANQLWQIGIWQKGIWQNDIISQAVLENVRKNEK